MSIASPYCGKTDIRLVCTELAVANVTDTVLDNIIAQADAIVEVDLAPTVPTATLRALSTIPASLKTLSTYKARTLAYRYLYDTKANDSPNAGVSYWDKAYQDMLLAVLRTPSTILGSSWALSTNKVEANKYFGDGDFYQRSDFEQAAADE